MARHNCENCKFRAKYDNTPGSLLGKLWRWHINWCPGWSRYYKSLPEPEKVIIADRYKMKTRPR
jgi:hypothetical protein